jgi:hypothetical protein
VEEASIILALGKLEVEVVVLMLEVKMSVVE